MYSKKRSLRLIQYLAPAAIGIHFFEVFSLLTFIGFLKLSIVNLESLRRKVLFLINPKKEYKGNGLLKC